MTIHALTWMVLPFALAIKADLECLARSIGDIGCSLGRGEVRGSHACIRRESHQKHWRYRLQARAEAQKSGVQMHACFSPFPVARLVQSGFAIPSGETGVDISTCALKISISSGSSREERRKRVSSF